MDDLVRLRQEFLKQAHAGGPAPIYDAQVTEVDDEAYTCSVLIDGLELHDIRLRAVVSTNQSIDVLPKAGTAVLVGWLNDDDFYLLAADEIDSYRITTGDTQFKITADGVLIQKNDETLKSILNDLVTGLLSVAAPKNVPGITALTARINNLLK